MAQPPQSPPKLSEHLQAAYGGAVGGAAGHLLRRAIHLGMGLIPLAYYWRAETFAQSLPVTAPQIVSLAILTIAALEAARLWMGWTVFGQRAYEARQVSALAWGALSVGLVLLAAPRIGRMNAALGVPLIWTLSFGDPLLGEARRLGFRSRQVAAAGVAAVAAIWAACAIWLGTPWWLAPIMAPLSVAAEWPRLKWIDDNAMMTLIPLAAVLTLEPWY